MGARSGALFNETLPRGVMPVAGHCQHVGVAGFTLNGGNGWGSRYFGAATDNVLSMDVVTVGCADCPQPLMCLRNGAEECRSPPHMIQHARESQCML